MLKKGIITIAFFAGSILIECGNSNRMDQGSNPAIEVECQTSPITAEVEIGDFYFNPSSITIPLNGIVKWTNRGNLPHTITSGEPNSPDSGLFFNSGPINSGNSYCLQFTQTGSYLYYCVYHSDEMKNAVVNVE